jgi:hypothetical protein
MMVTKKLARNLTKLDIIGRVSPLLTIKQFYALEECIEGKMHHFSFLLYNQKYFFFNSSIFRPTPSNNIMVIAISVAKSSLGKK